MTLWSAAFTLSTMPRTEKCLAQAGVSRRVASASSKILRPTVGISIIGLYPTDLILEFQDQPARDAEPSGAKLGQAVNWILRSCTVNEFLLNCTRDQGSAEDVLNQIHPACGNQVAQRRSVGDGRQFANPRG